MSQHLEGWTEPWSGSHPVCNGNIIDWTCIVLPIFAFIILICSAFQMCMHRTYTWAGNWNVQCAIQFQASGMITKITVVIMVGRKQMWYIKQGKYYCLVLPVEVELLPDVALMMMAFPSCLLLLLNADDNSLPTFLLLPIVFLLPGPPLHPSTQYSVFSRSLYQLPAVRQEAKFVLVLQYHHVINNICCFCISKIDPVLFTFQRGLLWHQSLYRLLLFFQ